jgi:AraC-like DNA-binding protein
MEAIMYQKANVSISNDSFSIPYTMGIRRKNLPFIMDIYGYFKANGEYYTKRSGKNKLLLFYTLSGQGYLEYRNNRYILNPGQVAVIDCNEYQHYKTYKNQWEFVWIHFSGDGADRYFNLINNDSLSIINIRNKEKFKSLLESIKKFTEKTNPYGDLLLSDYICRILTVLALDNLSINAVEGERQLNIDTVIEFIENNYQENISLEKLAKMCHLSKFHFLRVFKKQTGFTPYEFITNYRMNMSKHFLIKTKSPVSEISEKVGYNNVNTYIKCFKNQTGTTPNRFRISAEPYI